MMLALGYKRMSEKKFCLLAQAFSLAAFGAVQ